MYDGQTLLYEIHFIYNKNKVVKEIWYDANTHQVIDEVNNSYNQQGEMIRNESTTQNYYVTYTYTTQGDLESWFFFIILNDLSIICLNLALWQAIRHIGKAFTIQSLNAR